jgi:phosphohistidine phosphatase
MLVGHDPAMRELTLELASPTQPADAGSKALERVAFKFPTAAIAVLSFGGKWSALAPGDAELARFVTPSDLHAEPGPGG